LFVKRCRNSVLDEESCMKDSPITDEELEQAAAQYVEMLRMPFRLVEPGGDPKAVITLMLRAFDDPEGLKREIVAHARKEDPAKIKGDVSLIADFIRAPRKFLTDIIKETAPPGTPGKRPQITEAKEQEMIRLGRSLLPAAEALIHLRQSATKRSMKDSIEYLAADFPEQAQLLLTHLSDVEAFFSQPAKQPKSLAARAKKLVFRVLAKQFGITASYAERWLGPSLKSS
jgi:hypothetical protein